MVVYSTTDLSAVAALIKDFEQLYPGVKVVYEDLNSAELQSVRGSVLQKMGRHAEAAEAFQISLRGAPQNGAAWLGFGISLEALGRRSDAAESFRRAAATGMLGPEASSYAEQRARQLQ